MFRVARSEVGIGEDVLKALERDVYNDFFNGICRVVDDSRWGAYERGNSHWVVEFAKEYMHLVRISALALSSLLARWVMSHSREEGEPLNPLWIVEMSFGFLGELLSPGFTNIWLVYVTCRTRGSSIPDRLMPLDLALDLSPIVSNFYISPDDVLSARFGGHSLWYTDPQWLGAMSEPHSFFMPESDAIPRSVAALFRSSVCARFPRWGEKLRMDSYERILAETHVGGPAENILRLAAPLDPKNLPSLSQAQAASLLDITPRTIRNYVRQGKLTFTPKKRVCRDERFERQFSLTHAPLTSE
jgi:hypothetical protein